MEARNTVIDLVRELEGRLRSLLADAAKRGDYAELPLLTSVARVIGHLAKRIEDGSPITTAAIRLPRPTDAEVEKGARRRPKKRGRKRSRRKAGYPKFFRQGSNLVKIGYSKKKRGDYSHRTSREAVMMVVDAVARAGTGGKLFTTEDFMPVTDPTGDVDVLGYQSYIVLAWMKHEGLVIPEGRLGYRVAIEDGLAKAAEERWRTLATR